MGTDRSDQIYAHYLEASEKFDYFVLGVSLALVGYLGAELQPTVLDLSVEGLQAFATIALLVASVAGFKRLESHLVILKTMQKRLYSEESAGALAEVVTGGQAAVNTSTGKILTPQEALDQYHFHTVGADVTAEWLQEATQKASLWYTLRNGFLILGLVLLLISRILPLYLN